jgi:hypothetical protein
MAPGRAISAGTQSGTSSVPRLLDRLATEVRWLPVLVVGTHRDAAGGSLPAPVVHRTAEVLHLGPLAPGESAMILSAGSSNDHNSDGTRQTGCASSPPRDPGYAELSAFDQPGKHGRSGCSEPDRCTSIRASYRYWYSDLEALSLAIPLEARTRQ